MRLYIVTTSAQKVTKDSASIVFKAHPVVAETEAKASDSVWSALAKSFTPLPEYFARIVDSYLVPEELILAAGYIKAEDKDETIKKLEATLAAEQLAHDEYRKQAEESYGVWRIEIEELEKRVNWYKLMWKEANDMMVRLADKHKKLSDIVRQALTPEQYHAARKIVESEP